MNATDVQIAIYEQATHNYFQYMKRCERRLRLAQEELDEAVREFETMETNLKRWKMVRSFQS